MREYYGYTREERGQARERFPISMSKEMLVKVDKMTEIFHANRPEVIEIMVAFYFAYAKTIQKERKQECSVI